MDERALVKNAGDRDQVKKAAKKEKSQDEWNLEDIRHVMRDPLGRRFIWRLLGKEYCKTFESIYENSARIHYNAGRQDIGHKLLAEVIAADEQAYLQMQLEAHLPMAKDKKNA